MHDLQECTEASSGQLSLGQYELHDLVNIDAHTVGMIIKVRLDLIFWPLMPVSVTLPLALAVGVRVGVGVGVGVAVSVAVAAAILVAPLVIMVTACSIAGNSFTCLSNTQVERDSFKVLDNLGAVRTIRLQEMGPKRNTKSIQVLLHRCLSFSRKTLPDPA